MIHSPHNQVLIIILVTEIEMPSKQYYLEVKDGDICSFDRKTSMATALAMGSTEVVLKDRSILLFYLHGPFCFLLLYSVDMGILF